MIVERVEHPTWLSNAYLVADGPGGHGVLIDANGLEGALVERAREERITITHVLCTHGHPDHVVGIDELARDVGAPLVAHPDTPVGAILRLRDGDRVESGTLAITALETPGHCADHLAFLVGDADCFTADVLFKGTVGGCAGPTGDYDALRRSVLDVLLALPPGTRVHPGHREPTTIGDEAATNPFVLAWRAPEEPEGEPCTVGGRQAALLLWAPDYDGGHKAWVRFPDGSHAVVGGSRVAR